MKCWRLCRSKTLHLFILGRGSVEEKYKDEVKYAVVYSIIMDLLEHGAIDRTMAEKINRKCAEQLGCRKIAVR